MADKQKIPDSKADGDLLFGARDQIRTGDPHVGNVMLYQLSYSCINPNCLTGQAKPRSELHCDDWYTAPGRIL